METIVQIFPDVAIAIADASPDITTLQKASDPITSSDAIRRITGDVPAFRIDLTDPPSQPTVSVGPYQASGADADAAMKSLASMLGAVITAMPAPIVVTPEVAP